jgi:hypothetical protein
MKKSTAGATVTPFPRERLLMVDGGRLGLRKHTVHGLVELDVARARRDIRRFRAKSGRPLSFSAFFLACLGAAIKADRSMHAYRDWRNRLVVFDEVDVNMLFEVTVGGQKTIRPHILRGVNRKSAPEIQREIDAFQAGHEESRETGFIDRFVRLPGFLRRAALAVMLKNPRLVKEYYGTVMVSSIGMFGKGSGWGIPVPNHTLQITLGGLGEKPVVAGHKLETRSFMCATVSVDHDIVDGAPVARFTQRLKSLVELGFPDGVAPMEGGGDTED